MEEKTDLRIRKPYKALCDAFVTILEKKRFDDLTVNELCDEAMIRCATFYKHFADQYDFFSFFIRQKQDQFISQAKEETPPNGIYAYTLYRLPSFSIRISSGSKEIIHFCRPTTP